MEKCTLYATTRSLYLFKDSSLGPKNFTRLLLSKIGRERSHYMQESCLVCTCRTISFSQSELWKTTRLQEVNSLRLRNSCIDYVTLRLRVLYTRAVDELCLWPFLKCNGRIGKYQQKNKFYNFMCELFDKKHLLFDHTIWKEKTIFLLGKSVSKIPSLQNVSLEWPENLHAYFILKGRNEMKWNFQVFTIFRFVFGSFV